MLYFIRLSITFNDRYLGTLIGSLYSEVTVIVALWFRCCKNCNWKITMKANKAQTTKRYHKKEKLLTHKIRKDSDLSRRSQQNLRCFRCLEFGYIAKNCTHDTKAERGERSPTKFATPHENDRNVLLKSTKTKRDSVWMLDSTSLRQNFIIFND